MGGMMKIAKVSDTHYGFDHKTHEIHVKVLREIAKMYKDGEIEALLHAGDWVISEQHQVMRTWKLFRKELGDLPIWTVMGNHDHWDYSSWGLPLAKRRWRTKHINGKSYGAMENDWETWAGEFDISLLEPHGPIVKPEKNLAIYGFNGWYEEVPPNTNDSNFMPKYHESAPIHSYLRYKAGKKVDECMEHAEEIKKKYPGIKTLLLTHHPSYNFEPEWAFMSANMRWMPFIAEHFDFYCVGHSHRQEDFIYKSPDDNYMRCINAGSCDIRAGQLKHRYNAPVIKVFDTEKEWDLSKAITL